MGCCIIGGKPEYETVDYKCTLQTKCSHQYKTYCSWEKGRKFIDKKISGLEITLEDFENDR